MHKIRILLILLFASQLSCSEREGASLTQESLTTPLPAGYIISSQSDEDEKRFKIIKMIPKGQSSRDRNEEIAAFTFVGAANNRSPKMFYADMKKQHATMCSASEITPYINNNQNGYQTLTWDQFCFEENTTMPKATLFKVIRSDENFYSIQITFMFSPSEEQLAERRKYLESVNVCNKKLSAQCAMNN